MSKKQLSEREKQYIRNINYFTKWSGLSVLGLCIAVFGLIIFLKPIGYNWFWYFMPYPVFIAGIVVYIVGQSSRTTENDFKAALKIRCDELISREPDAKYYTNHGRDPEVPEKMVFETYVYDVDGLLVKRLKSEDIATSRYKIMKLFFFEKGLYYVLYDFSLTEEDEQRYEELIDYSDVHGVDIERSELVIKLKKGEHKENTCFAVLRYGDGMEIRIPREDDAFLDDFVHDLLKKCHKAK